MVVKGVSVNSAVLHDILDGNLGQGPFIYKFNERISDSLSGKACQINNLPDCAGFPRKSGRTGMWC